LATSASRNFRKGLLEATSVPFWVKKASLASCWVMVLAPCCGRRAMTSTKSALTMRPKLKAPSL